MFLDSAWQFLEGFVRSYKGYILTSAFFILASMGDAISTNMGFVHITAKYGLTLQQVLDVEKNPFIRILIARFGFGLIYLIKFAYPAILSYFARDNVMMRYFNIGSGILYTLVTISNFSEILRI